MPLDIRPDHLKIVEEILAKHVPDREVWAFGSRVNGTAKETSDLDLAVIGETPLDFQTLGALRDAFSESDIPYKVDVVDWATTSETFREIVLKDKVVIQKPDSLSKGWLYHPDFPNNWIRTPLYSLAKWINGLAFRELQFCSSGKPVIKIAEIKNGISEQTKFTNQSFDQSLHIKKGDLLFSWSGQPETSIDAFWWHGPNGWLNQHIYRVLPIENIDRIFFFYLLRYLKPNFIAIARNKQTTGLGHVTKRDLEKIEAAYPPLSEQCAIAHILGTLDDKIELNRRMNETLEAMAQAIFNSWFVNFDPVRAKMEGRLTGLPKEIADLFPDSFEDSDLGEIPRGWRIGTLGEFATRSRQSIRPNEIKEGTPYIALEHMPRRCISLFEWKMADEVESNKFEFNKGDILFGKLRPYFHKVGVAPVNGVCSTDILVIAPQKQELFGFVLGHVSSDSFVQYTDLGASGTRMPRTNWENMKRYSLVVPPISVSEVFSSKIGPLVEKILSNVHESKTLSCLRDALLHKLLSGEIKVQPDSSDS